MFEDIRRDYLKVLFVFLLASSIFATSQSIVTTALVHIMNDFNVSSITAQWAYSIFLLTLGVIIPLNAFISRRFKARSIYLFTVVCFIVGSLLCCFSWNMITLILGRILQAVSYGIIMPYTQIILLKIAPEDQWQMFMGIYGISIALTSVLGMIFGGYIIDFYGWKNIFTIFVILSILTLILGLLFVKVDFGCKDYPLDVISAILSFIGCFGVIFGFTNISQYSLLSIQVLLPIVLGMVSLVLFFRRQNKLEKPLINMSILKNRYFAVGILVLVIGYFMYNGCTALIPIFVQGIAGHDAITTSLIVFPGGVALIIFYFVGPLLATRFGIKVPIILGCAGLMIGHIFMVFFTRDSSVIFLAVSQFIRYVGFGLLFIPIFTWAISMVSDSSEDASTVFNTSREIAGSIGSSILVVVTSFLAGGEIGQNSISEVAFSQTSLILIILTAIILIISILFIKEKEHI